MTRGISILDFFEVSDFNSLSLVSFSCFVISKILMLIAQRGINFNVFPRLYFMCLALKIVEHKLRSTLFMCLLK